MYMPVNISFCVYLQTSTVVRGNLLSYLLKKQKQCQLKAAT